MIPTVNSRTFAYYFCGWFEPTRSREFSPDFIQACGSIPSAAIRKWFKSQICGENSKISSQKIRFEIIFYIYIANKLRDLSELKSSAAKKRILLNRPKILCLIGILVRCMLIHNSCVFGTFGTCTSRCNEICILLQLSFCATWCLVKSSECIGCAALAPLIGSAYKKRKVGSAFLTSFGI